MGIQARAGAKAKPFGPGVCGSALVLAPSFLWEPKTHPGSQISQADPRGRLKSGVATSPALSGSVYLGQFFEKQKCKEGNFRTSDVIQATYLSVLNVGKYSGSHGVTRFLLKALWRAKTMWLLQVAVAGAGNLGKVHSGALSRVK